MTLKSVSALVKWGGIISFIYIISIIIFLILTPEKMKGLELNEWGDFFAGVFAPLAFTWLVIGYFQNNEAIRLQSEELKNSVQEMKAANETYSSQLKSTQNMELLNSRNLFFGHLNLIQKELDAIVIHLFQNISDHLFPDGNSSYIRSTETMVEHIWLNINSHFHVNQSKDFSYINENAYLIEDYLNTYNIIKLAAEEYDATGGLASLYPSKRYERLYKTLAHLKTLEGVYNLDEESKVK